MNAFFKKHFGSRSVRAGGYAAVASAIVVAIAIAVNLLVSALPETVTHPDFTENQLYTLSDQTKRITNALEKDVTLSLIASSGNENTTILSLLKRYEGASAHITVETVDPVLYPNFARQYTSGTVRSNSVVVACGDRSRYVDYSDIFKQVKSDNYDTYYYYVQMGYSQYYDYLYDTVFDGENALTAAINYVSSDSLTKIYTLSGHSEAELSETFTEAIKADNFEFESLHLMDVEAVPEDAGLILINAPASDLSEDEAALLIDYLDAGGQRPADDRLHGVGQHEKPALRVRAHGHDADRRHGCGDLSEPLLPQSRLPASGNRRNRNHAGDSGRRLLHPFPHRAGHRLCRRRLLIHAAAFHVRLGVFQEVRLRHDDL